MGWAVLRFGRSQVAFAGAISFMFLVFFGFNKQAFCNYYFFVIGGMCCAVAASDAREIPARQEPRPPFEPERVRKPRLGGSLALPDAR